MNRLLQQATAGKYQSPPLVESPAPADVTITLTREQAVAVFDLIGTTTNNAAPDPYLVPFIVFGDALGEPIPEWMREKATA